MSVTLGITDTEREKEGHRDGKERGEEKKKGSDEYRETGRECRTDWIEGSFR